MADCYEHSPCAFEELGFIHKTLQFASGKELSKLHKVAEYTRDEAKEVLILCDILLQNPLDVATSCFLCRESVILVQQLCLALHDSRPAFAWLIKKEIREENVLENREQGIPCLYVTPKSTKVVISTTIRPGDLLPFMEIVYQTLKKHEEQITKKIPILQPLDPCMVSDTLSSL